MWDLRILLQRVRGISTLLLRGTSWREDGWLWQIYETEDGLRKSDQYWTILLREIQRWPNGCR